MEKLSVTREERLVKIMKKTHFGLLLTGICLAAFLGGVATGYVKNKHRVGEISPDSDMVRAAIIEEETVLHEPNEVDFYEVTSSGDFIVLYEVFSDNTKNELERTYFNTSVLPKDDISLLSEGLSFSDKEDALMMMENFVS